MHTTTLVAAFCFFPQLSLPLHTLHTTVSAFDSCEGSPGIMHDCTSYCHPVSRSWMQSYFPDLTTERSLDSQAKWVIIILIYCPYVCTTSRCQAFGRLMKELNVFTLGPFSFPFLVSPDHVTIPWLLLVH